MSQVSVSKNIKLKAYLQLIRAPGLFSIITNVFASSCIYFLLVPSSEVSLITLSTLLVISFLCYQSGMILNDIADFSEDSRERAFRPLPSGRLSKQFALYCSVLFFIGALMFAAFINHTLTMIVLVLTLLICSYNFLTKESWFGPINMGLIRMVNWLLIMAAMEKFNTQMLWVASLVLVYTTIVTLISRFETINFPSTVKPILLALVSLMLVISLNIIVTINTGFFSYALLVFIGWLSWKLISFTPKSGIDTQRLVTSLLKGMIILDASIILSFGYLLFGALCAMLFFLSSKLAKHVYMT